MIVGIDASRIRSGGGISHIIGILSCAEPKKYGISEIHIWSYKSLLDKLPSHSWLKKHNPSELEGSLLRQIRWQAKSLPKEMKETKGDILFTLDASTVCKFNPNVVLSQDMLSFEEGQMQNFGFTLARLRLIIIGLLQKWALKRAQGAIFLTNYASDVIQKYTGPLQNIAIIPHGIADEFRQNTKGFSLDSKSIPIKCIYVSNAEMYKHQWIVVEAISKVKLNYNVNLSLVGGGQGKALGLTKDSIQKVDPEQKYIKMYEFIPNSDIPPLLAEHDIFIFASSCENLPITLLEGMASGLPIASSDRGPMPEVLGEAGIYFDPEDSDSIKSAIEKIILNKDLRDKISKKAKDISEQYTWNNCSNKTWEFLKKCFENQQGRKV